MSKFQTRKKPHSGGFVGGIGRVFCLKAMGSGFLIAKKILLFLVVVLSGELTK